GSLGADRPALGAAADAALRSDWTGPRVAGALQPPRGRGCAGGGTAQGPGALRVSEELRDLYQKLVIDHARHPRNFCRPQGAGRTAEGNNPLCGDRIAIHLVLAGAMGEESG